MLLRSYILQIDSGSYIIEEKFFSRFGMLVFLFVLSMWVLILSPRLVRLLLGWDGLGVTSYLLVCYYSSEKRFNASILTALTNRVGDVALLLRIALWAGLGGFSYLLRRNRATLGLPMAGGVVFILAAITKRAQIPFSSWLPAAIAAPTPVSALVHSSTLVTAGVYILIRLNFIVEGLGGNWALLLVGAITTCMAGASALFEKDIKKVVALSTLRQLGVMFFSLGVGAAGVAFSHLISHAYFKAILFWPNHR